MQTSILRPVLIFLIVVSTAWAQNACPPYRSWMLVLQHMKSRIFLIVLCTALSFFGISWTLQGLGEVLDCAFGDECKCSWDNDDNPLFLGISVIVMLAAWACYCLICYKWAMNNYVEKKLRVIGASFGVACILMTAGFGLLFAFPAVALMLYIHFRVPYGPVSQTKQSSGDPS